MDDLRPDRDDVDRFQQQRGMKAKAKPAKEAVAKSQNPTPKAKASGQQRPGMVLPLLLIVVISAVSGFYIWELRTRVQTLEDNLAYTSDVIKQSKLLMARIEGQVHETGSEMEEKGSVTQRSLAELNSEVRKLWGVSNDRNKKAIAANQDAVQAMQQKTADLESQLKALTVSQDQFSKRVDGKFAPLAKLPAKLSELEGDLKKEGQQLLQLSQNVQAVGKSVSEQEADLKLVRSDLAKVKSGASASQEIVSRVDAVERKLASMAFQNNVETRVKSTEDAIEAIDASRRQINQRVVQMERRLNEIQLSVNAMQSSKLGGQ